jgi:hypothetical protein
MPFTRAASRAKSPHPPFAKGGRGGISAQGYGRFAGALVSLSTFIKALWHQGR